MHPTYMHVATRTVHHRLRVRNPSSRAEKPGRDIPRKMEISVSQSAGNAR